VDQRPSELEVTGASLGVVPQVAVETKAIKARQSLKAAYRILVSRAESP